ncbi:MAG: hypothetical protein WCE81_02055 [Halobacteriota archaeon]
MGYDDLVLLIHAPKKKLEARSDIVEMQHCRKQLIQISKQSHFRFYHESGELSKRRHNDKRACPKLFALLPFFLKKLREGILFRTKFYTAKSRLHAVTW